ncbi:uncharacterized protein FTOL_12635 [Fusarium torulosum]|uniref:Uncharacterized protein n=1 Tax=Fusarium torulosum TaxID=33205 RepID=A0AAE8MM25_9HYPO|nr:uncharacterized protein FTOL_12635 [Fusarium torulosum]
MRHPYEQLFQRS